MFPAGTAASKDHNFKTRSLKTVNSPVTQHASVGAAVITGAEIPCPRHTYKFWNDLPWGRPKSN